MESVQLEPSAVYTVTDLNFIPADQKKDVSGWDERQCTFNDLHCNFSLGNYWIMPFSWGGGGRSEISAVISCWQLAFLASYCSSKIRRLLKFENVKHSKYRTICGINDQLLFLQDWPLKTVMTALKVRDIFLPETSPVSFTLTPTGNFHLWYCTLNVTGESERTLFHINRDEAVAESIFGRGSYMNPNDTRQYLYKLTPVQPTYKNVKVSELPHSQA